MSTVPHIPKWLEQLLERVLPDSMAEFVIGDLEEYYAIHHEQKGRIIAQLIMLWSALGVFLSFAFTKSRSNSSISMYSHYLKVAVRSLKKQRLYSAINVTGMAVGVASFILIASYVAYELSYDQAFANSSNIYQVIQRQPDNEFKGSDRFAVTPAILGDKLQEEVPQVVNATTIARRPLLIEGETRNLREWGLWADKGFAKIFELDFVHGSALHAFDTKEAILLTETTAEKLFGEVNPVGKRLNVEFWSSSYDLQVSGVVADPPSNSSFEYAFIVNLAIDEGYQRDMERTTFSISSYHTFVELQDGVDLAQTELVMTKTFLALKNLEVFGENSVDEELSLVSLLDIHLDDQINFDLGSQKANTQYLLFFGVIAVIVLVLSCINYMNIAIASSINRVREVGVRKAIGAFKSQIIGQFWGEALLVSFLAVLLGAVLAFLFAPFFGEMIQRPIQINPLVNPWIISGVIVLAVVIGLVAGSYPALVISKLKPASILKGIQLGRMGNVQLQKVLIVFQFAASILLIIGSLFTYKQLQFISNKDLGFTKENVLAIEVSNLIDVARVMKSELEANPNILSVSGSSELLVDIGSSALLDLDTEDESDDVIMYTSMVDDHFLETYDIELIAGRNFSSAKEKACIVNETAVRKLGLTPQEALGKVLDKQYDATIVGVIKDFHMHAMREPIAPLFLRSTQGGFAPYLSVKIQEGKVSETHSQIAQLLTDLSPNPAELKFVDEHYNQLYLQEYQLADVFGFFTIIAVVIASMGLFGLAALAINKRAKEVSIRKVLGASAQSIIMLLSRDFMLLVGISFVMAVPVAWYMVSGWLENYAYHMDVSWTVFLVAGVMATGLAALAILFQTLRASRRNPVEGLRTE